MNSIKYYQNNPCVIIRDVNDQFVEIQLNTHFAANIEAEYYCTPSECRSPMSSGEAAQEEYEQAQAIIEDIQNEEHSIICMVEKRLLHDAPIEVKTIMNLIRQIESQKEGFALTKDLHDEWKQASKSAQLQTQSLNNEISALELSLNAISNIRKTAEQGIDKLQVEYNKILVQIGHGNKKITISEYDKLVKRDAELTALERGGVDNWEWYDESLEKANINK